MKTFFHGTNAEAAASILKDGVDIDHPRKKDPGDFGQGFYLTTMLIRAKVNGHSILEVDVDTSKFAFIPNPYQPIIGTEAGFLFKSLAFTSKDEMLTCAHCFRNEERKAACVKIRKTFMDRGFQGIMTKHHGDETVVFDLAAIKSISFWITKTRKLTIRIF